MDKEYEITTRLSNILTKHFRESFAKIGLEKDGEVISPVDQEFFRDYQEDKREEAQHICGAVRNAFFATFSVYRTTLNLQKLLSMSQRYPWHGTGISKSDHFDLIWNSFVNECYHFEERTKIMGKHINYLQAMGGVEKTKAGGWVKVSSKALREHIQFRGKHVHSWSQIHKSYSDFSLYETLSELDEEYAWHAKFEYRQAKKKIKSEINSAILQCYVAFELFKPDPIETLKSLVTDFDHYLETQRRNYAHNNL